MTGYVPQSYIKEDIKSIVTHEQFASIEYKVEEEINNGTDFYAGTIERKYK